MSATRFLILSDTHNVRSSAKPLQRLPSAHVLLHCGDLTENGTLQELKDALTILEAVDAELKLFIAGNHDAILDRNFWLDQGGDLEDHLKAVQLLEKARDKSIHYLEEGCHTFTIKLGTTFKVYATPYTPQYGMSAFQHSSAEDRYNDPATDRQRPTWAKTVGSSKRMPSKGVDIVMSHGPPKYVLDSTSQGGSAGCEHLRRAIGRGKPQLHAFGHVHTGYGVQRVEWQGDVGTEEDWDMLGQEFVGKNETARRGYGRLPRNHEEEFRRANALHREQLRKGDGEWAFPQTVFVNAAIMDSDQESANLPWLVELDL